MPSLVAVPLATLTSQYGALQFDTTLKTFVAQHNAQDRRYIARPSNAWVNLRGLAAVDVWHRIKFDVPNLQVSQEPSTLDVAHVEPIRKGKND